MCAMPSKRHVPTEAWDTLCALRFQPVIILLAGQVNDDIACSGRANGGAGNNAAGGFSTTKRQGKWARKSSACCWRRRLLWCRGTGPRTAGRCASARRGGENGEHGRLGVGRYSVRSRTPAAVARGRLKFFSLSVCLFLSSPSLTHSLARACALFPSH